MVNNMYIKLQVPGLSYIPTGRCVFHNQCSRTVPFCAKTRRCINNPSTPSETPKRIVVGSTSTIATPPKHDTDVNKSTRVFIQPAILANQAMTPEANVFLVVNLGCEMLYVIGQRLKAQQISEDKSTEVVRDITSVLLEPKFVERLIIGSQQQKTLITAEHCKFMLGDIACCSLMRLDEASMGKLWNLMTMIFKWQMFVAKHPQHLLDITFRHLDGVAKMYSEMKKTILVDYTKNTILDFWNSSGENLQFGIYKTVKSWLECFNVKISLLLRLGFQALDSSFYRDPKESYYEEFAETTGENIYVKSMEIATARKAEQEESQRNKIDDLQAQLNVSSQVFEEPKKNIFFDDVQLEVNVKQPPSENSSFVQLEPRYNPSASSWENFVALRGSGGGGPTAVGSKDFRTFLTKGKH